MHIQNLGMGNFPREIPDSEKTVALTGTSTTFSSLADADRVLVDQNLTSA
jgi:hypothetical protein